MTESPAKDFFAIQDQTAAIEAMFHAASLGIIISNSEGTIQQVNPYAHLLFGYEQTELIGQKIEVLIPRNLREKHVEHREHFNQYPRSRAMGVGIDLFALKKDGTLFPVEVSLTHYERNERKEIVSFVSDITERKKTEEALRLLNLELEKKVEERTVALSQAFLELQHTNANLQEEMEQRRKAEEEAQEALEKEQISNELKSRFVSIASHEFRTPLSGILSSVSLIAHYSQPSDEEKRNKHIHIIKASVRNLTNILNDFLSLDKLEQNKIECRSTSFNLVHFTQELIEEMQSFAKPGQRILYKHQGDYNEIRIDQEMLRNILINLLSNAIKYSAEEKEIHVLSEADDSQIRLSIQDAGIGIPKVEQKHLFEKFFRAHNTTVIQGTGLGLNIVKRYLDLMGGNIQFTSRESEGSTFTITFPRGIES